MIRSYFSQLKTALILSPAIESYQVSREMIKDLEGYLRIKATLVDKGQLDIFIYVTINHEITIQKYSFHWQDQWEKLVKRWDNAPHHRELENFPHHLHLEGETLPSAEPHFMYIIKKIEEKIKEG